MQQSSLGLAAEAARGEGVITAEPATSKARYCLKKHASLNTSCTYQESPNTILIIQALLEAMSPWHNETLRLVDIRTI